MSFDIYGNNLRRGHCEVHPHVHEEYPCSVCIAEASQREQQQRPPYCDGDPRFCESAHYLAQASEHIKDQERTMATQQARIEALEKREQMLLAECKIMRVEAERLITKLACDGVQRLTEIRPDAGWDSGEVVAAGYIRFLPEPQETDHE